MAGVFFKSLSLRSSVCIDKAAGILQSLKPMQVATLKNFPPPPTFNDVEYPEKNKLRFYEKVPLPFPGVKIQKSKKRIIDMRGPELVHNQLIHKQYGIVALTGGKLRFGHFEMMRNVINRKMDPSTMFAIWRVDPPWKPITKKGIGKTMGGGKGDIDHYVTPVKAGRIILEMGGTVEYEIIYPILKQVVGSLPFQAEAISQTKLDNARATVEERQRLNKNPYTYEYIVKHNMTGCHYWISPYDKKWFGRFD